MKNMKYFIISAVAISSFLFSNVFIVSAHDGHEQSVGELLDEILLEQNISDVKDIDCVGLSEDQLEVLGDAVMGVMHPDEGAHDLMDQMMGGEGSDSLKARHIIMAQNYLGCTSGITSRQGMMGGLGMMGNFDDYSDLERGENASYTSNYVDNPIITVLFGVFLILGIIAFIKIIISKK